MTAATFDHQVGKSLEFFEQQRNEKTAYAHFSPNGGLVVIRDSRIERQLRNLPLLLIGVIDGIAGAASYFC
jgi:hypothetical protein